MLAVDEINAQGGINGKIALHGGKEILKKPKIKNIYFGGR